MLIEGLGKAKSVLRIGHFDVELMTTKAVTVSIGMVVKAVCLLLLRLGLK
jgi:hypothetical protein